MNWSRTVALGTAVLGLVMLLASGTGTKLGVWDFRTGLMLLRYAVYVGIAAMVLTVLALLITRPRGAKLGSLLLAFTLGLITFVVPWNFSRTARSVPPIHDITTDTADPPLFVALLPARDSAPNGSRYAGDSIAALQAAAYPDVKPLTVSDAPPEAFRKALTAATAMGWDIVAADSASGRIEATATTTWFGFKDDVVLRIRADQTGSRIDVRSMSRVGRSDVGANAARIRAFTQELQTK
jgi:uncharacterized protein (DUF1499 family)